MNIQLTERLAGHVRGIFFGGNWTSSNLRDHLAGLGWTEANTCVHSFNTIAVLVFHVDYYVSELVKMLHGAPLEARDKLSFELPPIESQSDWERLLNKTWSDAENLIRTIEKMPEDQLWNFLGEEKYGDFYANILGIVEHTHYHLGQIVLIRKILNSADL